MIAFGKRWNCTSIQLTASNENLARVMKKMFKKLLKSNDTKKQTVAMKVFLEMAYMQCCFGNITVISAHKKVFSEILSVKGK